MRGGQIVTNPLNSKFGLMVTRIFCTLQVFTILFLILALLLIIAGIFNITAIATGSEMFFWIVGCVDFILTLIIVWIKKWYPIVWGEEKLK